jgi:hypothetical protein
MSGREKDVGRLAAREQEKEQDNPNDADSEGRNDQENQESKENQGSQENQESTQDTTHPADDGERSNPASDPDAAESGSEPRSANVKDRGATLFAYLPESLDNTVDLACQSVNLTYQQESGEKLGKNQYLYPIILMVGADNAVDLSYDQIQDLVERVDEVEDAA